MTLSRKEYDQKVSAIIRKYKNPTTQQQFEWLVALTRVSCEKLLKHISIKGVVQGRTKALDFLERKLELPNKGSDNDDNDEADNSDEADTDVYNNDGEVPSVRKWVSKGGSIYKYPEIGDLAGIRIGLYFPDDFKKVALEIEKHFKEKHRWGTVKGGRNATRGRNLDPQGHL